VPANGWTWTADVNEQLGTIVVTAACGAAPCTITATRSGVGGFSAPVVNSASAWGTTSVGPIYPLYVQLAARNVPMPSTVTVTNAVAVMAYQIDIYASGKWNFLTMNRQTPVSALGAVVLALPAPKTPTTGGPQPWSGLMRRP
jgi:hypothetical protein